MTPGQKEVEAARRDGVSEQEIQAHVRSEVEAAVAAGFDPKTVQEYYFGAVPDEAKANKGLAATVWNHLKKIAQPVEEVAKAGFAVTETVLHAASGLAGGFPAYLGGGVGTLFSRAIEATDEDPKVVAQRFSEFVTYKPQTQYGESLASTVMTPFAKLTEASEAAGKKVADVTESPVLAAITEATISMLPFPVIGSLGRRMAGKLPTQESIRASAVELGQGDPVAAAKIEPKLKEVYEKTGIDSQAITEAARNDPTVMQDIMAENRGVPESIVGRIPDSQGETLYRGTKTPDQKSSSGAVFLATEKSYAQEYGSVQQYTNVSTNTFDLTRFKSVDKYENVWAFLEGSLGKEAAAKIMENAKVNLNPESMMMDVYTLLRSKENVDVIREAGYDTVRYNQLGAGADYVSVAVLNPSKTLTRNTPQSPPPPPKPPAAAAEKTPEIPPEDTVRSHITSEPEVSRRTPREFLDDMYTRYFDRHFKIPDAKASAEVGVNFDGGIGPREAMRLSAGAAGKAEQFIERGTFNSLTYETNGPSLRSVLKKAGDDVKGFEDYLVAKHSVEREAAGKQTGLENTTDRAAILAQSAKYEPAAREFQRYKDALVDYAVDAGIIPKASVEAWRAAYKDHVPFYRFFEDSAGRGAGKTPRNPVMRATGSERQIIDPIISVINDTYTFIRLAEENMARQKMLALPKEMIEKVPNPARPIKLTDAELKKMFDGAEVSPEVATVFRSFRQQVGKDQILIMRDGKPEVYKVNPDVAEAYNGLSVGSSDLLTGMASFMRAGVVLTFEFQSRNMMRDAVSAFVFAGSHPLKTVRGAVSYFKQDTAFQNWHKGGGANAAMVSVDRHYLEQHMGLADLNAKSGLMSKTWNVVKSPIEAMRIAAEVAENVTRLGAVVDDIKVAKSKAQIQALSLIAREATVDFSRHGSDPFLNIMSRRTAFLNPTIQGFDRTARAFKDNPVGSSVRAMAAITMPSVLLWYANHDDQWKDPETGIVHNRWNEMPAWQRDLFWIVLTDKAIYRIPKPFELGVVFGSIPERTLDAYFTDKPDAFRNLGKSLANVFSFNLTPTAAVPVLQQMTNYNFFTDRPLISASDEKLLSTYQQTPYTTEFTKALAKAIGALPTMNDSPAASPIVIDNYIRGWSGALGQYAVQLADLALRKTGVLPDPIKPSMKFEEWPVIRAFTIRYPSAQAQSIQNFYENYKDSKKLADTVKYLASIGDVQSMMKEMAIGQDKLAKMDGVYQGLSASHKTLFLIEANQKIPADEKRQLMDMIYSQMIVQANIGNMITADVKKTLSSENAK